GEALVGGGGVHGGVAGTAGDRVIAAAAGQRVTAGAAGDRVVDRVPGAPEVAEADEHQVVDIGAQGVGEGRRLHRVDAGAGRLGDDVGAVVDAIGVIPGAADHRVDAGPAVDRIVAGTAGDRVGKPVAGAGEGAGAGGRQV